MNLDRLIESLNITHEQACTWCNKTPRQWRRYRSGATAFPEPFRRLITLQAGHLGSLSPDWIGWRIEGDTLISPEGLTYSATWFRTLPWYLEKLRAERARLRKQIRELERQRPRSNVVPFQRQKKGT